VIGWPCSRIRPSRSEKSADQIEQGGLSAARRPEQREKLPIANLERDVLKRKHGPAGRRPVEMAHLLDSDLPPARSCDPHGAGVPPLPMRTKRSSPDLVRDFNESGELALLIIDCQPIIVIGSGKAALRTQTQPVDTDHFGASSMRR